MFTNRMFFFTFLCIIIFINDVVATSNKPVFDVDQSISLDSLSPNEIIVYMNQGLQDLTTKINQIEQIYELKELKNGRLGQLENYFNAYGVDLNKEDQSKLLNSINEVKKVIDLRIKILDLGYGDDESFQKGMDDRLEGIKEGISSKNKNYTVLNNSLVRLMGSYNVYMKSNTSVDLSWQKKFKDHHKMISRRLEEEIPEYNNYTKKFTWTWTLEAYKIEKSTTRLTRLDKNISKLRKEFVESYSIEPPVDYNEEGKGKKDKQIKKISKLSAKKESLILKQGKVIDKKIIQLRILLCEKLILPKEKKDKVSYWGIESISLPLEEKSNNKQGGLCIENEFKLKEKLFEDIGIVKFKLRRNALEIEKDVILKSEEETIDWSLFLKTNKDQTITELKITPSGDESVIAKLGVKDRVWIVCRGDLDKANKALLKKISQGLKLKIK